MTHGLLGKKPTDSEYANELSELRDRVLLMGARVEELMTQAAKAFRDRDANLARRLVPLDSHVDQLELEIDERCLRILARRHPVASDLRLITTALKLVTDLERIGDLCVNVCERILELKGLPRPTLNTSIGRMSDLASVMLRDALDAFVDGDAAKARQVIQRDRQIDAIYKELFPELVSHMIADPEAVFVGVRLQAIGKYVERIADHATNIAEMVVFMVDGKDVRHLLSGPRGA
jgi:phosphate transport system protein